MLRAGERVGDWVIEAPLGEGGMGAVYRVHSAMTRRLVAALKVMKPTEEPDARARFVREAEALSALRHPAVVRVMGFSEDPERGLLYLVMELAVGETLRQRVNRGPMELSEALATFVPLAQGLDHAHAAGISHRDLKPANVILTVDGTPRLVDFGIAAALHAEPLTTTGQLGTLPYLPPEVFRGERADPAAIDVYAFGLLLHEALTGERPFAVDAASTPAAAAAAIGVRKLQAPSAELPAHFPERVRDLVRRATAADPKARPTMRELRTGLESAVERRGAGDPADRYVPVAPPVAMPVTEDKTTRVPDPTDVPLVGGLAEAVGITGSRGVGRRRGDRTRIRLLSGVGIAAAVLAGVLFQLARRPGAQPVSAGSSRTPSEAATRPTPSQRSVASPVANTTPQAERAPSTPTPAPRPSPAPTAEPKPTRYIVHPMEEPAPPDEPPDEDIDQGIDERDPEDRPSPEPRVGGRWRLTHRIESASYAPFEGVRLGYEMTLVQNGTRVSGHGRKVSENGVPLPPGQRTPIDVSGRIENGQVVLDFTETGASRTSRGTIRWRVTPGENGLEGRFVSDAADSRGVSVGLRLP
jgi:serine/threonine-protein kinase